MHSARRDGVSATTAVLFFCVLCSNADIPTWSYHIGLVLMWPGIAAALPSHCCGAPMPPFWHTSFFGVHKYNTLFVRFYECSEYFMVVNFCVWCSRPLWRPVPLPYFGLAFICCTAVNNTIAPGKTFHQLLRLFVYRARV